MLRFFYQIYSNVDFLAKFARVSLRNNHKVAALLQPLFGKVSSRNVVFMLLFLPDFAEFLEVRKVENGDGKRK